MFRQIIRKYMDAEGWTIKELAECTGIGRVNLGQKLKGKTTMTVEELSAIAKVLDIMEVDLVRCLR